MKNEIKTGLERNKKYTVDYMVKDECYSTVIYTTSQKRAKEMLKEMIPDARKIVAKHWAPYCTDELDLCDIMRG